MYNIDDEQKWGKLIERRVGQEFEGEVLGEEFNGYAFKITGGTDNDGFAMRQGILINGRVRLILKPGQKGFVCRKTGARRRKGVRGCIVGTDIAVLHLAIVKKGDKELEGLTDVNLPRRLGPKRANKIRRMFLLPKHSDNLRKNKENRQKIEVDKFDVRRYVVQRVSKEVETKKYYKSPSIQRLVTAERLRRKRVYKKTQVEKVKASKSAYENYVKLLKSIRDEKTEAKNLRKKSSLKA